MSESRVKIIPPGRTIGIWGGGQLGRMLTTAGRQMGYRFITLDPTEDSPCGQAADEQILASFENVEAARDMAKRTDVITYEFENVDAKVAALLEEEAYVPQGSELLRITQHRLREKQALQDAGAQVAPYAAVHSEQELLAAAKQIGLPAVLKTVTGGYDGKGQVVIRSEDDIPNAFQTLAAHQKSATTIELVLEKFIPFIKELSVIAARNPQGELQVFPAAENVHINNILHLSIVPPQIPIDTAKRAEQLAMQIASALHICGLLAVELFLTAEGQLYVNELAPRPHNSGHYTMDACDISQFEQHIRAICGLPLAKPRLLSPVVMVNVLGQHLEPLQEALQDYPKWIGEDAQITAKWHLYGKHEAKPNRKMGHVNIIAPEIQQALDWVDRLGIWQTEQYERMNKS